MEATIFSERLVNFIRIWQSPKIVCIKIQQYVTNFFYIFYLLRLAALWKTKVNAVQVCITRRVWSLCQNPQPLIQQHYWWKVYLVANRETKLKMRLK